MNALHSILQIENLTTGYQTAKKKKIISEQLDLQIKTGSFTALLGPNGCGKSTLLRTIAGLQAPLQGNITIQNIHIQKLTSKEKARLLSLILTDRIASAYLIVKDIVGIGRYPHIGYRGILSEKDKEIVQKALKQCDLAKYAQSVYTELSDGEKQRVMLARALAQDTPLMMLDEPTAHLDLPNRVGLMKMLRDLAKKTNKAILLSTHELDLALQWCDGIWLMNENGEVSTGVPEDLVLNGDFSKVFSNHSFYFDIQTGTFKINSETTEYIALSGLQPNAEWTRRALEREGFAITTDKSVASYTVHITNEKKWLLNQQGNTTTCKSIAELIAKIQKKNA